MDLIKKIQLSNGENFLGSTNIDKAKKTASNSLRALFEIEEKNTFDVRGSKDSIKGNMI